MEDDIGIRTIVLIVGIFLLFGVFFWVVITRIWWGIGFIADTLDGVAERRREEAEREARLGRQPGWKKFLKVLMQAICIAGLVLILAYRFGLFSGS